jgi:septal ring factor EnvC (AmiA/AmiB activator)
MAVITGGMMMAGMGMMQVADAAKETTANMERLKGEVQEHETLGAQLNEELKKEQKAVRDHTDAIKADEAAIEKKKKALDNAADKGKRTKRAGEASMMARCTGKTRLHNLEPEDLRVVTLSSADMMGVPLAGTREIERSPES